MYPDCKTTHNLYELGIVHEFVMDHTYATIDQPGYVCKKKKKKKKKKQFLITPVTLYLKYFEFFQGQISGLKPSTEYTISIATVSGFGAAEVLSTTVDTTKTTCKLWLIAYN